MPYLLLDIDGVLAPFSGGKDCLYYDELNEWIRADARTNIAALERLFTVVWASARDEKTVEFARGLDVGPFPFISFSRKELLRQTPSYDDGFTWKLPWVEEWALRHPEAEIIWVDDELRGDAYDWAARRTAGGQPTHLFRPQGAVGLDADMMADLSGLVATL